MKKSILIFSLIIATKLVFGQTADKASFNKPLSDELDSIFNNDQKIRNQLEEIVQKYGMQSKEARAAEKECEQKDSSDRIKVTAILDKYGWLGSDVVGEEGAVALFIVIQHSYLKTQEKYLPMLREAVKNGKAKGELLAYMEDRVSYREGKKQIYGTQFITDSVTGVETLIPIEDPDNVDKRRAQVGLGTMAEELKGSHLKWDVERYKKGLPLLKIEEPAENRNGKITMMCPSSMDTIPGEQLKGCEININNSKAEKISSFTIKFNVMTGPYKGASASSTISDSDINAEGSVSALIFKIVNTYKSTEVTLNNIKASDGKKVYNYGEKTFYIKW